MKRIAQLLFTLVAVALVAAQPAGAPEPLPRDNPDDVAELLKVYPATTKLDAHGNIIEIHLESSHLGSIPAVRPALRRLHHVRTVSVVNKPRVLVATVLKNWGELESVVLWNDATDEDLRDLEGLQSLKDLGIDDGRGITDEGVKSIARLKNLDRLIFRNACGSARVSDACMNDIASLPNLKWLDMRGSPITDKGVSRLKGKDLEFLGLISTRITDRAIDDIKGMTSLKRLEVSDTKVTNAAIEKLKGIRGLEIAGLPRKESHEIPDDPADVAAIEAAGITATKDNVTDNVWFLAGTGTNHPEPRVWTKHLKGLHSVKELRLPDETTDGDLQYLAGLKSLERLSVGGHLSDEGLKRIGALTNLKELLCGGSGITTTSAKHLAPLTNLEHLDLTGNAIGDEGLRYLAGMQRLKNLGLNDTKISDAGLVQLRSLSALEQLDLIGTGVTDAGLRNLRGLDNLILIRGAGTREGLIRLKKDLPKLVVPPEER